MTIYNHKNEMRQKMAVRYRFCTYTKKAPASVLQVLHLQCLQSVAGPRIELGTS